MEQDLKRKLNACEQSLVMTGALEIKTYDTTMFWMVNTIRNLREQWHSSSEMVIGCGKSHNSKTNLLQLFLGYYKSLMRLPRI
jgi:hypothetical protein